MTGTRLMLPLIVSLIAIVPATGDVGRKGKTDAQVQQLSQTLRTEPDEKKRQAAVAELREADPRTQTEVIPALVAALQRDRSPQVRADAAAAIGQFKIVFPAAGLALEAAAATDPAPIVRRSSQQALWEYYLGGYRTLGGDEVPGSTPEPPIAPPAPPRRVAIDTPISPTPALAPLPRLVMSSRSATPRQELTVVTPKPLPMPKPVSTSAPIRPWVSLPAAPPLGTERFSAMLGGWPHALVAADLPELRVIFSTEPLTDIHNTPEPPLASPLDSAPRSRATTLVARSTATPPPPLSTPPPPAPRSSLSLSASPDWMVGLPDVVILPSGP